MRDVHPKPYVVHVCQNSHCENAWLDIDKYNAQDTPPRWRYCARCGHNKIHQSLTLQKRKSL